MNKNLRLTDILSYTRTKKQFCMLLIKYNQILKKKIVKKAKFSLIKDMFGINNSFMKFKVFTKLANMQNVFMVTIFAIYFLCTANSFQENSQKPSNSQFIEI